MRTYYCAAFCACCVVAACGKKHTDDLPVSANASAPVPDAQVERDGYSNSQNATAPLPANPRDLGALFQTEAASRPSGTIRVEDAIAAFRKDGIEITDVKQHLGRPYGARYCVGTKLSNLVAISLCEYVDATAAQAGVAVSEKIPLANREIHINHATSLTVRDLEKTPEADALAKRLFDRFAKLKTA